MASGLLALLDDVAALVKASAASLDDVATQVGKTTSKVSGIVIDDAAVTPKYVVGLDPARELSIIFKIARTSLLNKLVILTPAALLLGFLAPWAITPILMMGGGYLCFEGYEKVHSIFSSHDHEKSDQTVAEISPEELEKMRIGSAVRTDFILSAEIIAITFSTVAAASLAMQFSVLVAVGVLITVAVYGFVALIVKADDVGLHMAQHANTAAGRKFGAQLVSAMPGFLKWLGYLGTAAMLWVGGEIIAHGIPPLDAGLYALKSALAGIPVLPFLAKAVFCAAGGLGIGKLVAFGVKRLGPIIEKWRA